MAKRITYFTLKRPLACKIEVSKMLTLFFTAIFIFCHSAATSQIAGPNNAAMAANVIGTGTINWTNPTNVYVDDVLYATAVLSSGQGTRYIRATNYGFAIPGTATITGILVSVMRQSSSDSGGKSIIDTSVSLVKNNIITGNNNASPIAWPVTMTAQNYGGAGNLWGTTWTPAEINNANFGVAFAAVTQSTAEDPGLPIS